MPDFNTEIWEWLGTKQQTLFGQAFDITSDSGRQKAADWLEKQINELYDHLEGTR